MMWLKRFGLLLAGVLVCFGLLLSPWGTALLLAIADGASDELTIEHESGGLVSTLKLANAGWQSENINAVAQGITLNLDWSCTLSFKACVELIEIQDVSVSVSPIVESDESPVEPREKITLPMSVDVQRIKLHNFALDIDKSLSVSWASLNTSLTFHDALTIKHLNLSNLQINLPEAQEKESTDIDIASISNWQYHVPELAEFVIPIDVTAKQLQITAFSLIQGETESFGFDKLQTDLSVIDSKIDVTDLRLQHPLANAQLEAMVDSNYDVDMQFTAQSSSQLKHPFSIETTIGGSLDQYQFALTSKGTVELEANGQVAINDEDLPAQLSLSWAKFTLPGDETIHVEQGALALDGNVQEYQLSLETGVSAKTLPDTQINLNARGNNKWVELDNTIVSVLGGELGFTGQLELAEQARWQGQITAQNIRPEQQWPELVALINGKANHSIVYDKDTMVAELEQLDVQGTWQTFPISVNGAAKYDAKQGFTLSRSVVSTGDNQLIISGEMDQHQSIHAKIALAANDFSQLYAPVQGNAVGEAQVSGTLTQPEASYQLNANDFSFQDFHLESLTSAGSVQWDERKSLDVSTALSNLNINDQMIETAKFELSGTQNNHAFTTQIISDVLNLESLIVGELSASSWQGEWQNARLESAYGNYQLSNQNTDIVIDWENNHYRISPHCWQEDVSKLCINAAQLFEQQIDVDIQGTELALLQWLNQFAPQTKRITSDTRLFFSVKGNWHKDALPTANFEGYLTPALIKMEKLTSPIDMREMKISAVANGSSVSAEVALSTENVGNIDVAMTIDDINGMRNMQGHLNIEQFILSPYVPFVDELSELTGEINGELNIYGTINQPLLSGTLTLADMTLAGDAIPGKLHKWDQEIVFKDQSAKIAGQFKFGEGDGVSDGELDWSEEVVGHLGLSGEKFEIEYRDTVRARFSPDIRIDMLSDEINVGGNVDVLYARIKVKELPPSAQSPSDDEVIINQADTTEQASSRPLNIALNVNIDPNQTNNVKLDAFGLQSDLRGSLELNKQDALEGFGDLRLINGTYQAYGQDLVIRKGDILFSGPMENPQLSIEAIRAPEKTKDDVIAGIRVSGAAEQPQIDVFSEPAFNQSETLSYLITGKAIEDKEGEDKSLDGQRLASALISVGLERGENRVDRLGRKLGIEDLSLGTSNSSNGTQVSLSGYIAPGVQLSYGVNVFDSSSEISLRYQLLPKLFFEATSGVESALDLYYQFSIDSKSSAKQENPTTDE